MSLCTDGDGGGEAGKKFPLLITMKPEINYENVKNKLLALVASMESDWNLFFSLK